MSDLEHSRVRLERRCVVDAVTGHAWVKEPDGSVSHAPDRVRVALLERMAYTGEARLENVTLFSSTCACGKDDCKVLWPDGRPGERSGGLPF